MSYYSYGEPAENMLSVEVKVPLDSTFAEMADVLDALTDEHVSVQATRLNPRHLGATGGGEINYPDLVFWIATTMGIGGGLIAFSKRFFEHLADDAHDILKRRIAEYAERKHARETEEWKVFLVVYRRDDEPGYVQFRWLPDDDVKRLSAAVMGLPETGDGDTTYYAWDDKAGRWVKYEGD